MACNNAGMKSYVREYPKNSVIFSEGETANAAFILTEGAVEIALGSGEKRSTLTMLQPVSVFGEMALLLKDQKRTATAIARSPSKVAEIGKADFDDFIEQSPKLISAVLKVLVERLQKTTQMVSKSPDLFLSTCEILHLLHLHTVRQIKYDTSITMIRADHVIQTVSRSLFATLPEVRKIIENLETLSLIEIKAENGMTFIEIQRPQDFLDRSYKIHETFAKLGV
jgi:CRP-like cAMP-binding protein